MKYYFVEFRDGCAICSRTIRTNKTLKDIENWVKTWKSIFKSKAVLFIQAKETNKNEWNKFIECFDINERDAIVKECTL